MVIAVWYFGFFYFFFFSGVNLRFVFRRIWYFYYGLTYGFFSGLTLFGLGFRCGLLKDLGQTLLWFELGYNHKILIKIPDGLRVVCGRKKKRLVIFGLDKALVQEFVLKIRVLRSLDIYKGKGVRLLFEEPILRIGKVR